MYEAYYQLREKPFSILPDPDLIYWGRMHTMAFTMGLQAFHVGVRAWCSGRIYGWKFASTVPLRVIWANWINCFATVSALKCYFGAKARGQPLRWLKTAHSYPNKAALAENRPKLGEILVGSQYVTKTQLDEALRTKPETALLGEYLLQLGLVTEEELYEAISLEQDIPFGKPDRSEVTRISQMMGNTKFLHRGVRSCRFRGGTGNITARQE